MPDASVETLGGLGILESLRDSILAAPRGERDVLWSLAHDPDNLDQLIQAWEEDEEAVDRLIGSIRGIHGFAGRADALRRSIQRSIQDRESRERRTRVEAAQNEVRQVHMLSQTITVPTGVVEQVIMAQLYVPAGYRVDNTGVYRVSAGADGELNESQVAASPIFLAGRTTDILTGESKRQVVWRGASGWCSRVVDRGTLMESRKLVQLAAYEAPVSSVSCSQVIEYLTAFEAENAHRFRATNSVSRMGWLSDGSFVLPDKHFRTDTTVTSTVMTPPPGLEQACTGWTPGGTWEEWHAMVKELDQFPLMMISIYAAASTPVLSLLNIPGFVVDFSGETSGGKTTALRLAASVWGRPSDSYPTAMYSWDSTRVWIERTAGFLHNLPLILDETKRAKYKHTVRDVIYDFCQGQGRGRGSVDGTRHITSWRSILISSGEGSATSFSQDAGTRARVLSLKGKPLGNDEFVGGRVSEDVQMVVAENYGHLGRKIVEYLVANYENRAQIREAYVNLREKYTALAHGAVARRHASHVAILETTARIAHALGLPHPELDPFEYLIEEMNKAAKDADRPLQALLELTTWASTNQEKFFGRQQSDSYGIRVPSSGWAGVWDGTEDWDIVGFTAATMRKVLQSAGYDVSEVIDRFIERRWLITAPNAKRHTRILKVANAPARCYCISRRAFELCDD